MTHDEFTQEERDFHKTHTLEDSYRPDCKMCGGSGK